MSNKLKWRSWWKWPLLASVVAVVFIASGVGLVSSARQVQSRIAHELRLLDDLGRLNEALHQLGLVQRVDAGTGSSHWETELARVRDRVRAIEQRYPGAPGIDEMPAAIGRVLHQADSLHHHMLADESAWSEQRKGGIITQFMVQRAQKVVEHTSRQVHEKGLGTHVNVLSAKWDKAQVMLTLACLFAMVFAWLVGVSNNLLLESSQRAAQLEATRHDLVRTNQELRETMLSKEEKEVMLKEIHHRVKNNLQIVKSLIRFQMDKVGDAHTAELFNECINRVGAMALVHEQTYLSKDLSNIDVTSYLDQLVRDLCHAYTIDIRLKLDIRIEAGTLGVDTLIPLGLLITEILSNALKYAFKGRQEGTILVHFTGDMARGLTLRIGDDGVGLPDRSRWERPNSLGIELIHTLAGQLDASVALLEGGGTVYELTTVSVERRKRA
ncbi:MAG: sensor histidine kinase [Flavobacteriales bacterium]|nr:sensor histidine kinase [Flavobacteriales bacterium]